MTGATGRLAMISVPARRIASMPAGAEIDKGCQSGDEERWPLGLVLLGDLSLRASRPLCFRAVSALRYAAWQSFRLPVNPGCSFRRWICR